MPTLRSGRDDRQVATNIETATPAVPGALDPAWCPAPLRGTIPPGLALRHIREEDAPRLRAFHQRLSPESARLRFPAPKRELSEALSRRFTCVDGELRGAVVAVEGDQIRGVARWDGEGAEAELAFVVEDAWQGRGLGRLLLHAVLHEVRLRGYERAFAMVLPENYRMLALLALAELPMQARTSAGETTVTLTLR